jgi:hypothetical protein
MSQWRNEQMSWTEPFQRKKSKWLKRHMKKCSASLAIKEMQNKTMLRFYLTPVRITTVKNTSNNKCWWGCGGKGTLIHCWCECKLVQPLWKTVWRLLKKLKIELPCDPTIPLVGIYLKVRLQQGLLHTHVYCIMIHNSYSMETARMPHCWQMD